MTTPHLIDDLKRDEGCKLTAYPDPLSGADPWTIGYGCTGEGIGPGTVWTQVQAEQALISRANMIGMSLSHHLPFWGALTDLRQDVLVNMAYNLGVNGLLTFTHTLAAVQTGQWDKAAQGMLSSKWAKQVGERADRLADQMRTGVHAE